MHVFFLKNPEGPESNPESEALVACTEVHVSLRMVVRRRSFDGRDAVVLTASRLSLQ